MRSLLCDMHACAWACANEQSAVLGLQQAVYAWQLILPVIS